MNKSAVWFSVILNAVKMQKSSHFFTVRKHLTVVSLFIAQDNKKKLQLENKIWFFQLEKITNRFLESGQIVELKEAIATLNAL